MSVIVTDTGFGSEDWSHEFHSAALPSRARCAAWALPGVCAPRAM